MRLRASNVMSGIPASMASAHRSSVRSWLSSPSKRFTATTNGRCSFSK